MYRDHPLKKMNTKRRIEEVVQRRYEECILFVSIVCQRVINKFLPRRTRLEYKINSSCVWNLDSPAYKHTFLLKNDKYLIKSKKCSNKYMVDFYRFHFH